MVRQHYAIGCLGWGVGWELTIMGLAVGFSTPDLGLEGMVLCRHRQHDSARQLHAVYMNCVVLPSFADRQASKLIHVVSHNLLAL